MKRRPGDVATVHRVYTVSVCNRTCKEDSTMGDTRKVRESDTYKVRYTADGKPKTELRHGKGEVERRIAKLRAEHR